MKFAGWCPRGGELPFREDESTRLRARLGDLASAGAGRAAGGWEDAVLAWNRERGAPPEVLARAREILAGGGSVVVTGQQPALGGGPLYTLYKLLTAVELAAGVERGSGRPCLAVFWLVGDDADFGEVSWACWPGPDGAVTRLREEALPERGAFIGRLDARRQQTLLDRADLYPPGHEGTALQSLLSEALAAGRDWSGVVAALLYRLWPGLPALFVDGAHPAVIAAQSGWLAGAAGWPLPELLREGAEEARGRGEEPSLEPEVGERALFRVAGDTREPLEGAPPAGALLSPNVVLRPLVQDLLLPNVATVCGPAEVRYRVQLGPLYRRAGIAPPALWPRMRAILAPARPGGATAELAADGWLALNDPDAWLEARARSAVPLSLSERTRALQDRHLAEIAALGEELGAFEGSLPQLAESVRGKVEFQLRRLEEGLSGKARLRLLRREPVLARWREFVRPRDAEQERALTLLTPFLLEPGRVPEPLRLAAREHLDRLGAGAEPAAAVFEIGLPDRKEGT